MGDTNNQKPVQQTHCRQPSNWKSNLDPRAREKVIHKIFTTLSSGYTSPELLLKAQKLARNFEEKVFTVASDQNDYLKKISAKMMSVKDRRLPRSAGGASIPFHSGPKNVQQTSNSQLSLQSAGPLQPQSHQIIQSNTPMSRSVFVSPSISSVSQVSRSNFAGQSCQTINFSTEQPNLEGNALDKCIPSNPMVASMVQEQKRHHLQQNVNNNVDRQFLEEQQARFKLPERHTSQGNVISTFGKNLSQLHQDQLRPTEFPYSHQTVSRETASDPPKIQSQSASVQMHNEGSSIAQTVTRQQRVPASNKRGVVAPQQKSLPVHVKQESIGYQSNSANNRQESQYLSPRGKPPETLQLQQHILPSNRIHNVEKQQQLHEKQIANAPPQRLGAQSTAHNEQPKQQTFEQHDGPLMLRSDSSGEQQASHVVSSSQGPRLHGTVNSQLQPLIVSEAKKLNSCVTSKFQNLPRSERGTNESGRAPLEVCKASEVASSGEKHGVAEAWREDTYQRIMVLKNTYASRLEEMHHMIGARLKQFNLQSEHVNGGQFKTLKDMNTMVERMLRLLHIPKEKLVPGHRDSLDGWEKQIIFHLSKVKSKNVATSQKQGQDPQHDIQSSSQLPAQAHSSQVRPVDGRENNTQTEQVRQRPQPMQRQRLLPHQQPVSLQAHIPHKLDESIGPKDKHLPNQRSHPSPQVDHTVRRSHHPKDTRNISSSTPSELLSPNHQPETQQPATLPSGKRKDVEFQDSCERVKAKARVISPSLSEPPNHNKNLGNDSKILCDKASVSQSPIERLVKQMASMSSRALKSSMGDMCSVMSMIDGMEADGPRVVGCISAVGQDLVRTTGSRMQARHFSLQDSDWCICPVPIESLNDQEKLDAESTAENHRELSKTEDAAQKVLEEIKEVNQRLIDTVVDICEEEIHCVPASSPGTGGRGIVVKCCFNGVSINSSFFKFIAPSGSVIQPLRLLIPADYPGSSPVLLDRLPGEVGDEFIDLSDKAKSRLGLSLRSLEDPISLSEIAQMWEFCARAVITEQAEKFGGGTFSSRYGAWENCLGAA